MVFSGILDVAAVEVASNFWVMPFIVVFFATDPTVVVVVVSDTDVISISGVVFVVCASVVSGSVFTWVEVEVVVVGI